MITILLLFLLIAIVIHSNLNSKHQKNQEMVKKTDAEITVPLKYLSNFWRTREISLINCKITLQVISPKKSIIVPGNVANQVPKFRITDTKLYVPVVTLSTQDNTKLLKQLESSLKRTMNWNKYHSKKTSQA